MNNSPPGPELRAAAPLIAVRLGAILVALGALVARAFLRHPRQPVIIPLWNYLGRTARRFTRVMSHCAAGTQRVRTPRPGPRTRAHKPRLGLHRTRAWLVADLKHEAVAYALHLEALLAEPEAAALVAATPQAQRLLRPLCHMLGIRPKCLLPPSPAFAGEGRGPSRSDGKGEDGATARPLRRSPDPDLESALFPRPPVELCPRLLTRWPFNTGAIPRPA